MSESFNKKTHKVNIDNREYLELTGVLDVPSFNEDEVAVVTDYGEITIRGSEMKLEALDLDSGVVKINGRIVAVIYNDKIQVKGFFKRAFSS